MVGQAGVAGCSGIGRFALAETLTNDSPFPLHRPTGERLRGRRDFIGFWESCCLKRLCSCFCSCLCLRCSSNCMDRCFLFRFPLLRFYLMFFLKKNVIVLSLKKKCFFVSVEMRSVCCHRSSFCLMTYVHFVMYGALQSFLMNKHQRSSYLVSLTKTHRMYPWGLLNVFNAFPSSKKCVKIVFFIISNHIIYSQNVNLLYMYIPFACACYIQSRTTSSLCPIEGDLSGALLRLKVQVQRFKSPKLFNGFSQSCL